MQRPDLSLPLDAASMQKYAQQNSHLLSPHHQPIPSGLTPRQEAKAAHRLQLQLLQQHGFTTGRNQLRVVAAELGTPRATGTTPRGAPLETPRTPREVVPSPRPLPEDMMKRASPSLQKKRRRSLNGDYIVGKVLGQGASGVVRLAVNKTNAELAAVKIVNKSQLSVEGEARLRREYAIMKHLDHPNLIKLIDIVENPTDIMIIMELANRGDLFEHVASASLERLPEDEARPLFKQIALGVQHLHDNGFVHRDLKLENILLGDGDRVFIADLGFGTVWDTKKITMTQCGSFLYSSPEIVGSTEYVGPEIDIWSLGVVLYAMVSGQQPFYGEDENMRQCILRSAYAIPEYFSPSLVNLLSIMLEPKRRRRANIATVLKHPWITGKK